MTSSPRWVARSASDRAPTKARPTMWVAEADDGNEVSVQTGPERIGINDRTVYVYDRKQCEELAAALLAAADELWPIDKPRPLRPQVETLPAVAAGPLYTECPECGGDVEEDGGTWYCVACDPGCRWVSLNIKGRGSDA